MPSLAPIHMPLVRLPDRAVARVSAVHGTGLLRERLVELGFVPGVEVEVLRRAPLGGPLQVRVRGGSIALRCDEAVCVEVEDPAPARASHADRGAAREPAGAAA